MTVSRREFVRNSTLSTAGLILSPILRNMRLIPLSEVGKLELLYKGFQNPPVGAKPFVRWLWNGNRLSEKEILRELDVLKKAGIGGVEINPIEFPEDGDPAGYEALKWLDDRWIEMLKVALNGASERGMICDMIVGSGWPFGGKFLEQQEQSQMVTIETLNLKGAQRYRLRKHDILNKVNPNFYSKNDKVFKEILMLRIVPAILNDFPDGYDLEEQLHNEFINVDVPPGDHVLYIVVKLTGFMAVISGAPGANGPVLNHYNKSAVERYLARLSAVLSEKIGYMGDYFRAMFCDSMELEGANWNDDLPAEFEKRRGYSLLPYLPFVLHKVGRMGNRIQEDYESQFSHSVKEILKRVELDFYQTRLELFDERFLKTFNKWCHNNGVQSRVQAYGRGMHPLNSNLEIDIPECETWLNNSIGKDLPARGGYGRAYCMINKFVSSGARLAGKRLVSCEEITNTRMVSMATLEKIKIAGDQSNFSGVTHSILNAYNYSPPEAGVPGWFQFGAWFTEKNPWWPYFHYWTSYKSRLSYIFQNADLKSDVAILQPLSDLWMTYGPQRDPFPHHNYPDYQHNLWEAVHWNGDGCDYISTKILQDANFSNGQLLYNQRLYKLLLIPEFKTLEPDLIESLENFARTGGTIVFIGNVPCESPDYMDYINKQHDISERIKNLTDNYNNVIIYPAPGEDLMRWYKELQSELDHIPYISFTNLDKYLCSVVYEFQNFRFYFFSNASLSHQISVNAIFNLESGRYPWIWNPENGEKSPYPALRKSNEIHIDLMPASSLLLLFDESEGKNISTPLLNSFEKVIKGPWKLHTRHMNGEKLDLELAEIIDLNKLARLKTFAGDVIYYKEIFIDDPDNYSVISLGKVEGVSKLIFNNKTIGVKWYGLHEYLIGGEIERGKNTIEIRVTTIAGNYFKSLKDNPTAQRLTKNQPFHPIGILGPVKLY